MKLGKNIILAVASSIWAALVSFAIVPIYLKYLGVEVYGLVGFLATMQALLQLLDLGLAPTVNREIARSSASGDLHEAKNLLHTLALIYFGIAIFIGVVVIALAPALAQHWLQSTTIPAETTSHVIILMGFVIACRWPVGLYQGVMMGAERMATLSIVNITMVSVNAAGSIGILAFVSQTIQALFMWQAFMALVHVAWMRGVAWQSLGGSTGVRFDISGLKRIWRFSAGVGAIAVTAIALSQLDKILLSKLLSLKDFGQYILATTLVGGLYLLINPVFNVIYPRFSALVAGQETENLAVFYRQGTRLLATFLFPSAMVLVICPESVVRLWTGDSELAQAIGPLVAIMSVGSAIHGVMYFPYALQLAFGMTRLPLVINVALMVLVVPMTYILAVNYGVMGGAVAWLLFHILYFLLGSWLTNRYLLTGIGRKWVIQDIGVPLLITLIVASSGAGWIVEAGNSDSQNMVNAMMLCLASMLMSFSLTPQRKTLYLWLKNFAYVIKRTE